MLLGLSRVTKDYLMFLRRRHLVLKFRRRRCW